MESEQNIPQKQQARLNGHKVALEVWRRVMREYNMVDAKIVTRLDIDLLIDYCMLMEQLSEIDRMRGVSYQVWLQLSERRTELQNEGEDIAAVAMALKVVGAFDAIVKLDARADQKRKSLLGLRQSLYMTPRARAGTAPKGKDEKPVEDAFEKLLNESVEEFKVKPGGSGDGA